MKLLFIFKTNFKMNCIFKKHLMIHYNYPNKILITGCCLHNMAEISFDEFINSSWEDLANLRLKTSIRDKNYCKDICNFQQINEISLGIIKSCNLNCYHCSSHIIKDKKILDDSEKYIIQIFNKIKSLKNLRLIALDGTGEIFTRYNLLKDFLSDINSSNTHEVQFMTNGMLVTEEKLKELYIISNTTNIEYTFKFSIDGITKQTYELSRPGGNFKTVIKNFINTLKYFPKSGVIFVVKKTNYFEVNKVTSFFTKLKSAYVEITADFFDKDMLSYLEVPIYHRS